MISKAVKDLVSYGLKTGLLKEEDAVYARNQILDVLRINEYEEPKAEGEEPELEEILKTLLDYVGRKGLLGGNSVVVQRSFDTKLMNCLMPRPKRSDGRVLETL